VHPYRDPVSPPLGAEEERAPAEDWALGGLLAAVGGARVAVALATGEAVAVDVTAAGLVGALGVAVIARLLRRA